MPPSGGMSRLGGQGREHSSTKYKMLRYGMRPWWLNPISQVREVE